MEFQVEQLSGHDLTGMVMFGGLFLTAAIVGSIYVVATAWQNVRRLTLESELKFEMIRQGRSAEEIAIILGAGGVPRENSPGNKSAKSKGISADPFPAKG